MSHKMIEYAYENAYYVPNIKNKILKKIIKIFLIKIINLYRFIIFYIKIKFVLLFILLNKKNKNLRLPKIDLVNKTDVKVKNLSSYSEFFEKNNWCFIKDFLNEDFYNGILHNWPRNMYFKFKNNPTKFYLWGFEYLKEHGKKYLDNDQKKYLDNDRELLNFFPYLKKYYDYILSQKMSENIDELFMHKKYKYECYSINCTSAKKNAFLIPHVDTVAEEKDYNLTINCIHFIDGNDEMIEYSGGTGIYLDNEFNKKIFVPTTLKNSLLVYNSKKNYYHGFNKIKKNGYRKAVAFQFFRQKEL